MNASLQCAALAVLSGCVPAYVDAELRAQRTGTSAPLRGGAPLFEYDILVATAGDRPLPREAPSSVADRVGVDVDDLLRRHGVQPIHREPGSSRTYVHLTLIHGPHRTVLWAERRPSHATSARRIYIGPSDPVRPALDAMLGEMLVDFVPLR